MCPSCANEYAKEKEKKNTTVLAKCHGVLLATISNYLLNTIIIIMFLIKITQGCFYIASWFFISCFLRVGLG